IRECGAATDAARSTIGTSTPRATSSAWDYRRWQQEPQSWWPETPAFRPGSSHYNEFHKSVVKLNPQFQYALSVALITNVGQHLYWEIMMSHVTRFGTLGLLALLALPMQGKAGAEDGPAIKTVFVTGMETHNWTQPNPSGSIQQIFQNPNAPFINSLVNGTSNISRQVAYATSYHNVLATASGNNPHIHPSEPNYIWAEAGTNFGVFSDADPFPNNSQDNQLHLVRLLTDAKRT